MMKMSKMYNDLGMLLICFISLMVVSVGVEDILSYFDIINPTYQKVFVWANERISTDVGLIVVGFFGSVNAIRKTNIYARKL